MSRPTILIAGGGTGGHVFPGVAVADALVSMSDVDVVFVGTARGLESKILGSHTNPRGENYVLELLAVEPMVGGGAARFFRGGAVAAQAVFASRTILSKYRPSVVLSVGGYAAGPCALAARMQGIPLALLEPNAVMGLTNKILSHLVTRAYIAWSDLASSFPKGRAIRTGVPLRRAFAEAPLTKLRRSVLVLGGSQGARVLNERVPEALGRLRDEGLNLRVVHQTGKSAEEDVRARYAAAKVQHATVAPFLDDVATAMAEADLVIGRAGAGVVSEILAVGRPSLLVPFPHAAGDHQAKNAEEVAAAKAGLAIREEAADSVRLAKEIRGLYDNESMFLAMAKNAASLGTRDAAQLIARDLLGIAKVPSR